MRPNRLQSALAALSQAMHETNAAIEEMRSERDPLAAHIFVARRDYQNTPDTKGGKRHERAARMSWERLSIGKNRENQSENRLSHNDGPSSLWTLSATQPPSRSRAGRSATNTKRKKRVTFRKSRGEVLLWRR